MKILIDQGDEKEPATIINMFKKIDGIGFQQVMSYEGTRCIFIPTKGFKVVSIKDGFILIEERSGE